VSSTGDRDRLLRVKDRSPLPLVRFVEKLLREFQRLEPFDRAMTLAAQAFTSVLPLVITTASLLGREDETRFIDHVGNSLALPASTRAVLKEALPTQTHN
jgi:membrane protein